MLNSLSAWWAGSPEGGDDLELSGRDLGARAGGESPSRRRGGGWRSSDDYDEYDEEEEGTDESEDFHGEPVPLDEEGLDELLQLTAGVEIDEELDELMESIIMTYRLTCDQAASVMAALPSGDMTPFAAERLYVWVVVWCANGVCVCVCVHLHVAVACGVRMAMWACVGEYMRAVVCVCVCRRVVMCVCTPGRVLRIARCGE